MTLLEQYRELELRRRTAHLVDDDALEEEILSQMDDLWYRMDEEEQAVVRREIADGRRQ